jgi:hypothetical protein
VIAIVMAIAALSLAVFGQDPIQSPNSIHDSFTLVMAIQQAEARYPAIRAAEEQKESAKNAIGVAQAVYLPHADLLWQLNRATTNKANLVPLGQSTVPIPTPPARETTGHSDWNTLTGVLFSWQPIRLRPCPRHGPRPLPAELSGPAPSRHIGRRARQGLLPLEPARQFRVE